ncbi:MAG TPA: DUF2793 domain-containing protein [Sphingomicrobium sp.]|nr:DUF2793 domain-containing protein [Sphingomicrobium sp.]
MTASQRLSLPFIAPGQAQKELLHNEALQALDIIVAAAVEEPPAASPPQSPAAGACYIVAPGATGIWDGRDHQIAAFTLAGWRYISPAEGMTALVRSTGTTAMFVGGSWHLGEIRGAKLVIGGDQVVGARSAAIASPNGGTTIDSEARSAISSILQALRQHGLIAQ